MRKSLTMWILGLAGVAAISAGLFAQSQPGRADSSRIITGDDIGFRVEGKDLRGNPTGTLMVRVNGQWVPATQAVGLRPATQ